MVSGQASLAKLPGTLHSIPPSGKPQSSALTGVVVGVVIICALYFGSVVLIPITLAILLCFVLSPLMELLRRLLLPRVVAALLSVLIAIGIIIVLGGIIGTQIAGLAGQAPQYETTIESKVASLQKFIGTNLMNRLSGFMNRIENTGGPQPKPATRSTAPRRHLRQFEPAGRGQAGSGRHHPVAHFVRARSQSPHPGALAQPDCDLGHNPGGRGFRPAAEGRSARPADPVVRIERSAPDDGRDGRRRAAA